MEGSIHVEDKPIPKIQIGDSITICESGAEVLKGKTVAINGGTDDFADALKSIFVENGAQVVFADNADIVVNVK